MGLRLLARHHTAEDGVVPVHRPTVLLGEELAGMLGDGVGDLDPCLFPASRSVAERVGDRDGAREAVVDRGGTGDEGVVERCPVRLPGPQDLTGRLLEVQHPVDGAAHHGPLLSEPRVVGAGQVVVPHADCDVRDHVGVELGVGDTVGVVVLMPRAISALIVAKPGVGRARSVMTPPGVECHRRLDVVPRIGMATVAPQDEAGGNLEGCDGGCALIELRVGKQLRFEQVLDGGASFVHAATGFAA